MNTKKLVTILIGVVLISFGIGVLSFKHYGFNVHNIEETGINFNGIDINDGNSSVKIGPGGIDIKDGDDQVKVGVSGVDIKDSSGSSVKVGPRFNFKNNLFNRGISFNTKNLIKKNIAEEKIEEITGIKTIDIETPFIDINIIPEKREDIKIDYRGYIEANYIPKLETKRSKNTLYIITKKDNSTSYNIYNSDLKLNIYVPISFKDNINIVTTSGDIIVSKMELSNVKLTAGSGDIKIYDLTSNSFSTKTSSGDQNFKNISSDNSNFLASSGDIEIYNFAGDVTVVTSSGEIDLHYENFDNNINATASSGDVDITLPSNSEFNLNANTSSGEIESSFPITVTGKQKNNLSGEVGNSKNIIDIETSSGNINIKNK